MKKALFSIMVLEIEQISTIFAAGKWPFIGNNISEIF